MSGLEGKKSTNEQMESGEIEEVQQTQVITHEELIFPYIRIRKDFGRQPRFTRDKYRIHANVFPHIKYRKKHLRKRLITRGVQAVKGFAETPMNTFRRVKVDLSLLHVEGGWPKDIDPDEVDQTMRHRKKLEKEEVYQQSMPMMYNKIEKFILQNNAVDVYGEMYENRWVHKDKNRALPVAKTVQIFRDISFFHRAVRKIIWAPENAGRMGVCHTPLRFNPQFRDAPTEAYFWDVENSSRPESLIRSGSHLMDINYHPKDMHSLCGGCYDGTVQFWDARVGPRPIQVTSLEIGHSDICTKALWINSKTNSDFFSAGMDGAVIWWDIRNLSQRVETTWLDPEKGQMREDHALGASCLEYEHTIPTKFTVGTETGHVMLMMKKGKSPTDKLINIYKAHRGTVLHIQRNPTFVKNFLTLGEKNVNIFVEDCKDSPIMWTAQQDCRYTHASWIPSRASVFMVTRNDGYFDVYDIIKNPVRPYCSIKVKANLVNKKKKTKRKKDIPQDIYLTYCAPCEAPSRFLAVGTSKGNVYMERLSDSLCMSEKFDKPVLAACFERETRREKMIEQRYREIRLRKRDKEKFSDLQAKIAGERQAAAEAYLEKAKAEGKEVRPVDVPDYSGNKKYDINFEAWHHPISSVEREFFVELEEVMDRDGADAWSEYADAVADMEKKKDVVTGAVNLEEALDVTAEDLAMYANMNYDDDDEEHKGAKTAEGAGPSGASAGTTSEKKPEEGKK